MKHAGITSRGAMPLCTHLCCLRSTYSTDGVKTKQASPMVRSSWRYETVYGKEVVSTASRSYPSDGVGLCEGQVRDCGHRC